MANTLRQDTYRPATIQSYIAMAFLSAIAVCGLLYFLLSIGMILFTDATIDLGEDGGAISAPLVAASLIALLEAPLRLGAIISFLVWLHRAYSNLSSLKAHNLEFSPGWAVGWWFIPFANIVKPFQIVREVYNESDPEVDPYSGFSPAAAGTPLILGVWWGTFLLSGVATRISDAVYGKEDLPSSDFFPFVFMVAGVLTAIAGASAVYLIWTITKRQDARALKIGESAASSFTPPPPPSFGNYQ